MEQTTLRQRSNRQHIGTPPSLPSRTAESFSSSMSSTSSTGPSAAEPALESSTPQTLEQELRAQPTPVSPHARDIDPSQTRERTGTDSSRPLESPGPGYQLAATASRTGLTATYTNRPHPEDSAPRTTLASPSHSHPDNLPPRSPSPDLPPRSRLPSYTATNHPLPASQPTAPERDTSSTTIDPRHPLLSGTPRAMGQLLGCAGAAER